jgi:hypothetical protein
MDEHRQVTVEVADLSLSPLESDFRSDVRNPVGEYRQLTLRHSLLCHVASKKSALHNRIAIQTFGSLFFLIAPPATGRRQEL